MLLLIVCAQECIHTELCRSAQGSVRWTRRSTSAGSSAARRTWVTLTLTLITSASVQLSTVGGTGNRRKKTRHVDETGEK